MPVGDWEANYGPAVSREDEDHARRMVQALQDDKSRKQPALLWSRERALAEYLKQAETASTSEERIKASELIAKCGEAIKDDITLTQDFSRILTQLQTSLKGGLEELSSLLKDNFSADRYDLSEWQNPSVSVRAELVKQLGGRASYRDGVVKTLQELSKQIEAYEKQSLESDGRDTCGM